MFKVNLKTLTLAATMKSELITSHWYTLLFKFNSDFSVEIFAVISHKMPVSRLKILIFSINIRGVNLPEKIVAYGIMHVDNVWISSEGGGVGGWHICNLPNQ